MLIKCLGHQTGANCTLKNVPGSRVFSSQGALSHLGRPGVCFPLMWFISNTLDGLNE